LEVMPPSLYWDARFRTATSTRLTSYISIMTHPALIERITRSLAYMLRHQPEQFDLELDEYGFADLDDVVQALNERLGESVEDEDVQDAVTTGDRVRYEIANGRIRALYGHSIEVKPGEPSKPPALLYVGVSRADAERAQRYGLRAGRRRFLHLALTPEDALETGRRSARDYVVITVNALEAWEEGINFYDRKSLFLSDPIPTHFLEVGDVHSDGYGDEEQRRFSGRDAPRRDDDRGRERHERFASPRPHGGGRAPAPASEEMVEAPHEFESEPRQEERAPEQVLAGGEPPRGGRRRRRRGGRRHDPAPHAFAGEDRGAERTMPAPQGADERHRGVTHASEERHGEPRRGGDEWRDSGQRAHGDERRETQRHGGDVRHGGGDARHGGGDVHRGAADTRRGGERHGEMRHSQARRDERRGPRPEAPERRSSAPAAEHGQRPPPARTEERVSAGAPSGFGSGVFEEGAPKPPRERAPTPPPPPRERRPEPIEKKREVADDSGFGAGI
jgi:putative RNA 2'-phosphotransferase